MMETQLILATIAQRYQLGMVPGHPVELQLLVTLLSKYGLPMTIHERKRKVFFVTVFIADAKKDVVRLEREVQNDY